MQRAGRPLSMLVMYCPAVVFLLTLPVSFSQP